MEPCQFRAVRAHRSERLWPGSHNAKVSVLYFVFAVLSGRCHVAKLKDAVFIRHAMGESFPASALRDLPCISLCFVVQTHDTCCLFLHATVTQSIRPFVSCCAATDIYDACPSFFTMLSKGGTQLIRELSDSILLTYLSKQEICVADAVQLMRWSLQAIGDLFAKPEQRSKMVRRMKLQTGEQQIRYFVSTAHSRKTQLPLPMCCMPLAVSENFPDNVLRHEFNMQELFSQVEVFSMEWWPKLSEAAQYTQEQSQELLCLVERALAVETSSSKRANEQMLLELSLKAWISTEGARTLCRPTEVYALVGVQDAALRHAVASAGLHVLDLQLLNEHSQLMSRLGVVRTPPLEHLLQAARLTPTIIPALASFIIDDAEWKYALDRSQSPLWGLLLPLLCEFREHFDVLLQQVSKRHARVNLTEFERQRLSCDLCVTVVNGTEKPASSAILLSAVKVAKPLERFIAHRLFDDTHLSDDARDFLRRCAHCQVDVSPEALVEGLLEEARLRAIGWVVVDDDQYMQGLMQLQSMCLSDQLLGHLRGQTFLPDALTRGAKLVKAQDLLAFDQPAHLHWLHQLPASSGHRLACADRKLVSLFALLGAPRSSHKLLESVHKPMPRSVGVGGSLQPCARFGHRLRRRMLSLLKWLKCDGQVLDQGIVCQAAELFLDLSWTSFDSLAVTLTASEILLATDEYALKPWLSVLGSPVSVQCWIEGNTMLVTGQASADVVGELLAARILLPELSLACSAKTLSHRLALCVRFGEMFNSSYDLQGCGFEATAMGKIRAACRKFVLKWKLEMARLKAQQEEQRRFEEVAQKRREQDEQRRREEEERLAMEQERLEAMWRETQEGQARLEAERREAERIEQVLKEKQARLAREARLREEKHQAELEEQRLREIAALQELEAEAERSRETERAREAEVWLWEQQQQQANLYEQHRQVLEQAQLNAMQQSTEVQPLYESWEDRWEDRLEDWRGDCIEQVLEGGEQGEHACKVEIASEPEQHEQGGARTHLTFADRFRRPEDDSSESGIPDSYSSEDEESVGAGRADEFSAHFDESGEGSSEDSCNGESDGFEVFEDEFDAARRHASYAYGDHQSDVEEEMPPRRRRDKAEPLTELPNDGKYLFLRFASAEGYSEGRRVDAPFAGLAGATGPQLCQVGQNPYSLDVASAGADALFDEYTCIEKVDPMRVLALFEDLSTDREERSKCAESIRSFPESSHERAGFEPTLKTLERCEGMFDIVAWLHQNLPAERDERGRALYGVTYRHKDAAYRGRLHADGHEIGPAANPLAPWSQRKTNLQGMYKDLRAPLVGEFAHDIDCENSEFRLVRSLARQLGLEANVPTICRYCDHRGSILDNIGDAHNVPREDAKRLPNMVMSGGTYRTWLRKIEQEGMANESVAQFVRVVSRASNVILVDLTLTLSSLSSLSAGPQGLQREVSNLLRILVRLPRFEWLKLQRDYDIRRSDKPKRSVREVNARLMPRVVESCENEVLGIIHRTFFQLYWHVLAKVFDGLIAEPTESANTTLAEAMQLAQEACVARGWHVKLIEKPLHGLQDEPIPCVVDARKELALYSVKARAMVTESESRAALPTLPVLPVLQPRASLQPPPQPVPPLPEPSAPCEPLSMSALGVGLVWAPVAPSPPPPPPHLPPILPPLPLAPLPQPIDHGKRCCRGGRGGRGGRGDRGGILISPPPREPATPQPATPQPPQLQPAPPQPATPPRLPPPALQSNPQVLSPDGGEGADAHGGVGDGDRSNDEVPLAVIIADLDRMLEYGNADVATDERGAEGITGHVSAAVDALAAGRGGDQKHKKKKSTRRRAKAPAA